MTRSAAALEQAQAAERAGGLVRLAVVAFVFASYWMLAPKEGHATWLAYGILAIGLAYSAFMVLARPYERHPTLISSWLSTASDSFLLFVFLAATAGLDSPYYLLLYISLIGVAFRFGLRDTLWISGLYALGYVGIGVAMGQALADPLALVVRSGFLVLIAAEAGLLSRELARQTDAKTASLEQLREALERLKAQEAARVRILNHVAHELGTPLTPIKLQMHLLQTTGMAAVSPTQQKAIAIIARNVEQIERLTRDALDTTRLQAGKLQLERARVDVALLVRETGESFEPVARQESIDLEVQTEDGLEVEADARRVAQVLANLVANAIKFTPASGRILLSARRDGDGVRVDVADTGRGIAREHLQLLFQPFSQVGDATARALGTGLGLFISKGIVEQHGGRIWCESRGVGHGATFSLVLPRRAVTPAAF